ncbi:L-gulono-gamma-lactone oxidase [Elysia marginata]|uniref:L-gulono-gamma-lactone oxidase n=1 Tax=Elysia marginata TaxID=1093978 RepID=A0AAV4F8U4_9GAST|nr:L-gulono-gamma-lactone oxidase [Elysia marginata]
MLEIRNVLYQPLLLYEYLNATILRYASEKGKKVKTVGCGHSPSDLACTTDFMISLARYNRVLKVVDLELMLSSGEVIKVSQTENAELLPVVCLSLGSVGVILSITFQCERAFNLHWKQHPDTLENVTRNLDSYVDGCDHFRMIWYPHTDSVVCYTVNRTKQAPDAKPSWFWDVLVGYHLLQIILWIRLVIFQHLLQINLCDHKFSGAEFQSLYPKWKEFCQAREKLDPNGMFLNTNLERVFGMKPSNSYIV